MGQEVRRICGEWSKMGMWTYETRGKKSRLSHNLTLDLNLPSTAVPPVSGDQVRGENELL